MPAKIAMSLLWQVGINRGFGSVRIDRQRVARIDPDEEDRSDDQQECNQMVPAELLIQVCHGKNAEDQQRDDFLNDFQLDGRKLR